MNEGLGYGKRKLIDLIIANNWKIEPLKKTYSYNELLFVIQELFDEEGKAYYQQHSGRSGLYVFRNFVWLLFWRNVANYDSMVLISSEKGTGKSSAAIMLAREWCKIIGIRFDPKRHIAYNNSDVMTKIDMLNPFEPLIADEAIRFASSEDWNKKENKDLKKKLAQIRTKHLFFVLCFPLKVYKVDKSYMQSFVNYWIDLFGRGVGACYVKDKNPIHDSWRMKEFQHIGSYNEFTKLSMIEKSLKKHPNFWQIIKFPKPPKWLYDRYLAVRESNVYDDENVFQNVSKNDIHMSLLVLCLRDIMMHDKTMTMNRLILHMKNEYDIPVTKALIQSAIEDSKQLVMKIREQASSGFLEKLEE